VAGLLEAGHDLSHLLRPVAAHHQDGVRGVDDHHVIEADHRHDAARARDYQPAGANRRDQRLLPEHTEGSVGSEHPGEGVEVA
jgi:hypothetical protein